MVTRHKGAGFSLIELSLVLGVIVAIAVLSMVGSSQYFAYQDGRQAGEILRAVQNAQRLYLADHPDQDVSTLTMNALLPYMPGGTQPILPSRSGTPPTIRVTVSPPVATKGSAIYDPSGSSTDSLWDAGR